MTTVEVQDWGWRHAGRPSWAVHQVDFTIDHGERVLLLGASGSGKSTLLHAMAGVLGGAEEGEETGRMLIDRRHPTRCRGQVGLVVQDPEAGVVLARVGDDVAFGLENLGVPRDRIWPRVRHALEQVGLGVKLDRSTSALSGGQKQRLAMAGAVAMENGLLLLDEPTANLDPAGIVEVHDAVAQLVAGRSTTLVVVEHRVEVWLDLVDRVVVLAPGGGLLADGPPNRVFTEHRQALLAAGVWVPGVEAPVRPLPPAAPAPPLVTGIDLTVGYHADRPVGTGLEVAIPTATSTVVTGPNGSGKTTLALTLAGLLPRLGGRVVTAESLRPRPWRSRWGRRSSVEDQADPARWRSTDLLTRIGTVLQQPEHQFVAATVADELAVGLRALGWDTPVIDARVAELLATLHLEALAQANPFTLSGGEKRRLSVGTVLATGPRVIFLDEPTFGQDRNTWIDLVRLVTSMLEEDRAVVSITHDNGFIRALGQHRLALGQQVTT